MKFFSFRSYLVLVVTLFISLVSSCGEEPVSNRQPLNILWIVADDLGTDLGCYENPIIKTPNLDSFANHSVRYTNFHTVTPVCSPSRSSMITGMYPISIDCQQHRTAAKSELPDHIFPITEYFKKAGYFVTNGSYKGKKVKGKMDYNFVHDFDSIYEGTDFDQRGKDQPFFAQIQVFLPHRPFHRDTLNPIDQSDVKLPLYYPDYELARRDWADYLETVQLVDRYVGKILQRMKKEGLLDNTAIFFFGDQGRPHLRAKQFLYKDGTNTPLMVYLPKSDKQGEVATKLVSNIDVSAASLALADITIPDHIQGQDFLADDKNRDYLFTMRDRMDGTVDQMRAIYDGRFKYIKNTYPEIPYTQFNTYKKTQYPVFTLMKVLKSEGKLNNSQLLFMADQKPIEELYDLLQDPYELNNLAEDESYSKELNRMRKSLQAHLSEFDRGAYPENANELQLQKERMMKAYENRMHKYGLEPDISDKDFLNFWIDKLER